MELFPLAQLELVLVLINGLSWRQMCLLCIDIFLNIILLLLGS